MAYNGKRIFKRRDICLTDSLCCTSEINTTLSINTLQYKLTLKKIRLPWWFSGKESACQCRRHGFDPWSRKILHASEQLSQGTWKKSNNQRHAGLDFSNMIIFYLLIWVSGCVFCWRKNFLYTLTACELDLQKTGWQDKRRSIFVDIYVHGSSQKVSENQRNGETRGPYAIVTKETRLGVQGMINCREMTRKCMRETDDRWGSVIRSGCADSCPRWPFHLRNKSCTLFLETSQRKCVPCFLEERGQKGREPCLHLFVLNCLQF